MKPKPRPWYLNPIQTCKVLNRIANRYSFKQMEQCRTAMDHATMTLWAKQEAFYAR